MNRDTSQWTSCRPVRTGAYFVRGVQSPGSEDNGFRPLVQVRRRSNDGQLICNLYARSTQAPEARYSDWDKLTDLPLRYEWFGPLPGSAEVIASGIAAMNQDQATA